MYTFNEFRARIPIQEIARSLGYWVNPAGGEKFLSLFLGNPKHPEDEIVIFNPKDPAKSTYFSRMAPATDKGNLINFVQNRLDRFGSTTKGGFAGVNEVLSRYLSADNTSINVPSYQSQNRGNDNHPVTFDIKAWAPKTLNDSNNEFLTVRRKLSPKTIDDFRSRCHIYVTGRHNTIAFPFRKPGQMEITNLEMRNYFPENDVNYKSFCKGGDKSSSCWIANFVPYNQVTDLYLFESAIDAMSFYELQGFSKQTTSAFISVGGHVTQGQIEKLIKVFPNTKWHCCFDKDLSGYSFDISVACWLKGKNNKSYKAPEVPGSEKKVLHIHHEDGKHETIHEDHVSLDTIKEYMKRNDLDDIEIIKPARGKDWNESLVLYKRFDMNLSPTEKITQAVEDIISRLDLRGYHGLSEQIQTKRNEIIKSLYQRLPYPFNGIIAQSNMYEMSRFGKLKMIGKEVCLEIENVNILDKCTQKNASGTHIVNFLRKENIDIFKNLSSNDLKGLLEKKSLTVSGPVERKFQCTASANGWKLTLSALKKKELNVESSL